MSSEGWENVFAIFDAALATSAGERDALLARECGDNARLRDEVESLLAANRDAQGFLSGGLVRAPSVPGGPSSAGSGILTPGTRIGVFEVESFAGAGGMGEVYRARDTRLERHVALKILWPDMTTDMRGRARLAYEARVIARLSHPHICALHDIGHHDGVDFLVMEYLHGETLASRLRRGPLPVAEAVRIAMQIAAALDAAHAEGIVHSDLKPANIMLVNGGSAGKEGVESKLLDFGLARFLLTARIPEAQLPATDHHALAGRGAIAGTPQYMAPEQIRGEEADPRSDIFSFGSVLYEMVSGRAAFAGATTAEVMSAVLRAEPSSLAIDRPRAGRETASASRRLDKLIGRCLEKEPDRRFTRMHEVTGELQQVARAVAAARERRLSRWAGVAVVALIAVGVAVWPRLQSRPPMLPPPAAMKIGQLTSLSGLVNAPTFSLDGTQVAFSWNGEREDNYDIYVKTVGESDVTRLTTDPAADTLPVWSPDGKEIAFLRDHPGGGTNVYSVLATSGGERKRSDFRIAGGPSARIAWSPDQHWIVGRPDSTEDLARNGSWALYLIPLGSGTPRRLTEAKAPDIDLAPAFSPNGRRLAYVACKNFSGRNCGVSVLELGADYTPAGPPRRLANVRQNRAIAWSRDGASVVYDTNARGRWELWRVSVDGGGEPERLEMAGDHSRQPAIASAGDRLAFERASQGLSIYKLRASGEPGPVLVSSAWDYNPQFSPDGRRIAFSSGRSGDEEIWLASADGSGARQLTHGPGTRQTLPAWSPDGRHIAFESTAANTRTDIWVISADGGVPRRVTTDPGDESAAVWSWDGTRIYFLSDRDGTGPGGGRDTWQVPSGGGPSTRVTEGGSSPVVFESVDGKTLIYQSRVAYEPTGGKYPPFGDSPLLAVPIAGGTRRQVLPCVRFLSWAVVKTGGLYYSPCGSRRDRDPTNGFIQTWPPGSQIPIQVLDLSTGRVRVLGSVKAPFEPNRLAVSPDGKTILLHRNTTTSDLMLIENFR